MALTTAQLTTLKAHIDASPDLNVFPNNSDGAFEVARLLNTKASPDFYIWKSNLTRAEIQQNGFAWVEVDNLTVGKGRIWEWMFIDSGAINPSKANVRAGIAEVWKGTAARDAVRLVVFQHCQTLATRVQKLFATGTGTTTSADGTGPATTDVQSVSYSEVIEARNLP